MKKNLFRTSFYVFILLIVTTLAYPQWIQTNWSEDNSFFELYTNEDVVFARTWDRRNGGRVFFTDDNGDNWALISSPDNDIDILSIVMLDDTIFAGTWEGFYRCTLDDIFWEPFAPAGIPLDTPICSIAMINDTLFAGSMGEIYKSSIGNINYWNKVNTEIADDAYVTSIIKSESAIVAGSDSNGVFITTDNGTNWTAINSGLTDLHIFQLVAVGTKMFAVTLKEGVFVSDINDNSLVPDVNSISWESVNFDLNKINCILPADNFLFTGTDSNGVYLSDNSGQKWIAVNTGMHDNARIWSMAISNNNIFAGTNEGILRINPADINNYTITASASEGGTISPEGSISIYEYCSQTFTIAPEQGYRINDVLVDGNSVGVISKYTFASITENHTIYADFAIAPHTIIASAGDGGTISPSGSLAVSTGSFHEFNITPSEGYDILDVLVDGVSIGPVSSYEFASVNSDHTISALFKSLTIYQINCGGDISSPYTADQYYSGGNISFTDNAIDTTDVINPAPQEVYQTERTGSMTYSFPNLISGNLYNVRLHFSENLLPITNFRRFDVTINGVTVLSNYDIYAETGAKNKVVVKEFVTTANESGQIAIEFVTLKYNATIEGIEIIEN